MSLKFIAGGSRTGKSSCLYKMVIDRSLSQPDARLLFIVPEQYTMQTQKKLVSLHPRHAVMNVDVLSFERLAYRVFEETGTKTAQMLDETGKSMIIRKLLARDQDKLHAFRGNIRRRGFVDQVKSLLSELMQYDISPQLLTGKMPLTAQSSRLYAKLSDIQTIYSGFLDMISGKYMAAEEMLGLLSDLIPKSEIIRGSSIFMDNFTGFTPLQYRLMEELLKAAPEVVMTLCCDAGLDLCDSSDKDDLFYLTRDTASRLDAICRKNHIERSDDIILSRKEESAGAAVDICQLSEKLFRAGFSPSGTAPDHIRVFLAQNPDDEMRFAAMKIHEIVRDGNYRYSQIAVVTSDMETYLAPARKWLARYQIPCFFDARRPVTGNILIEWLRSLLDMLRTGMKYESVFRFLRSGISPLDRGETDELENYVIAYGIRGSRWFKEFKAGQRKLGDEKLEQLNAMREKVAALLGELKGLVSVKKTDTGSLVRLIYDCMQRADVRSCVDEWVEKFEQAGDLERAKEYEQIYDVIIDLLEKIYVVLGDEQMSVREFSDVLEAGIAQIRVGIIPPGIDQVTFGDLRRTRLDDVKVLLFAGMNDGLVPRVSHPSGLINDVEREQLSRLGIELAPTAGDNLLTERFYLYTCLSKPSDQLILTLSAQDPSGGSLLPSRLIRLIEGIFPDLAVRPVPSYSVTDVKSAYALMRQGLSGLGGGIWSQDAGTDPGDRGLFHSVYAWFMDSEKYRERARAMTRAATFHYTGDRLSAAAVHAVYGEKLGGGVSMLELYASCAYAHFLSCGLKLERRQEYKVQPVDIGQIFHQALENYSRRVAKSGMKWRDIADNIREMWADEAALAAISGYREGLMEDTARSHFLAERIKVMVRRTVWALTEQIKKGDFEPQGSEMKFTLNLPSALPGGGEISLNGRIDRIDTCEDQGCSYIRVIDYKSGDVAVSLPDVYYGLQLQLFTYLNAAKKGIEGKFGKPVLPAGVFYYHIQDPIVKAESFEDMTDDAPGKDGYTASQLALLEELLPQGLAVEDPDIIRRLDRDPNTEPRAVKVKITKGGTIDKRSQTVSPDHFDLLASYAAYKSRQIAEDIFSGRIDVCPVKTKRTDACAYCDYRQVCGFSLGLKGYSRRQILITQKDEVFSAMARDMTGKDPGADEKENEKKGGSQDGNPLE